MRRAKRTSKSEDWSNYRRLRNRTTYAIRKAKANYERSIFSENDLNPKDFWRQVKKCYPAREAKSTSKTFKLDNKPVSNKQRIADAFCRYFTSVTSLIASPASIITNSIWERNIVSDLSAKVNPNNRHFYFNVVNYQEVLGILKSLGTSKAGGLDNIPPKLVKAAAEELAVPLTAFANRSLMHGLFPNAE